MSKPKTIIPGGKSPLIEHPSPPETTNTPATGLLFVTSDESPCW